MTREEAFAILLVQPDEPCLAGRRAHRLTQLRDQQVDPEATKRDLGAAYVEWRRQDWQDISCVVRVWKHQKLKIARRA